MDLIKNLSSRKLKRMKATLELFEFFGISEQDIRNLPTLIQENKDLKVKVDELTKECEICKNTLQKLNDPENIAKKGISDLAKDCFTLPDGDK